MTEIREPTVEEKIAGIINTWPQNLPWDKAVLHKVGAILAIPEIKEGLGLREKAKSGKLGELSEDQSLPPRLYWGGAGFTEEAVKNDMLRAGFRRVKVKG